jgi:hypothetical protein
VFLVLESGDAILVSLSEVNVSRIISGISEWFTIIKISLILFFLVIFLLVIVTLAVAVLHYQKIRIVIGPNNRFFLRIEMFEIEIKECFLYEVKYDLEVGIGDVLKDKLVFSD